MNIQNLRNGYMMFHQNQWWKVAGSIQLVPFGKYSKVEHAVFLSHNDQWACVILPSETDEFVYRSDDTFGKSFLMDTTEIRKVEASYKSAELHLKIGEFRRYHLSEYNTAIWLILEFKPDGELYRDPYIHFKDDWIGLDQLGVVAEALANVHNILEIYQGLMDKIEEMLVLQRLNISKENDRIEKRNQAIDDYAQEWFDKLPKEFKRRTKIKQVIDYMFSRYYSETMQEPMVKFGEYQLTHDGAKVDEHIQPLVDLGLLISDNEPRYRDYRLNVELLKEIV